MKSTGKHAARLALAALGLCLAAIASAGERMDAASIEETFRGMTLDGVYKDGSFFSETYNEDGTIRYHDSNGADSGDWSVKGNTFCTFYEGQDGACFYVERDGSNCFTFFAAINQDGTLAGEKDYASRGWNREKPSTCPKAPEASI
ncbi:MAG TPA: hypothetical protein VFB16_12935 [Bauldia sp.]|nr:hypothetical protein [Bauldia sp.]